MTMNEDVEKNDCEATSTYSPDVELDLSISKKCATSEGSEGITNSREHSSQDDSGDHMRDQIQIADHDGSHPDGNVDDKGSKSSRGRKRGPVGGLRRSSRTHSVRSLGIEYQVDPNPTPKPRQRKAKKKDDAHVGICPLCFQVFMDVKHHVETVHHCEYCTVCYTVIKSDGTNKVCHCTQPSASSIPFQPNVFNQGGMNPFFLNPMLLGLHLPQLALLMQSGSQQSSSVAGSVPHPFQHLIPGQSSGQSTDNSGMYYPYQRNVSSPSASESPPTLLSTFMSHPHKVHHVPQNSSSSRKRTPFVCELCNQWFLVREKFILHLIMNHSMNYCKFCSKIFYSKVEKEEHERKVHFPVVCDICKSSFDTNELLVDHYKIKHDVHTCIFCGVLIRPRTYYEVHVRKKHFCGERVLDSVDVSGSIHIVEDMGNAWSFVCSLCKKERKKAEIFGHFFSYHRLSLSCLIDLLDYEGLVISVTGTPAPASTEDFPDDDASGTTDSITPYSDEPQTCTACSKLYSGEVPKVAHDIFCLGMAFCKFCERLFPSDLARELHLMKEHGSLACVKCSDVFTQENNLSAHYLKVHNTLVCHYCNTFLSADEKIKDHLVTKHQCMGSILDKETLSSDLFRCTKTNGSSLISCVLCEGDITAHIRDISLIFQHLQHHRVALRPALHMLDMTPVSSLLDPSENKTRRQRINEMQNESLKSFSSELSDRSNTGSQFGSNEAGDWRTTAKDGVEKNFSAENDSESCKDLPESRSARSAVQSNDSQEQSDFASIYIKTEPPDDDGEQTLNDKMHDANSVDVDALRPEVNFSTDNDDETNADDNIDSSDISSDEFDEVGDNDKDEDFTADDDDDETSLDGKAEQTIDSDIGEADFDPNDVECVTDTSDDDEDGQDSNSEDSKDQRISKDKPKLNTLKKDKGKPGTSENKVNNSDETIYLDSPGNSSPAKAVEIICEVCSGKFIGKQEFRRHMQSVHKFSSRYMPFSCPECGKGFNFQFSLHSHMSKVHHLIEGMHYKCPFCPTVAAVKNSMRRHIARTHHTQHLSEELAYKCRFCDELFWELADRNDHQVSDHKDQLGVFFKCYSCSNIYSSKVCLKRHFKLNHPDQPLYDDVAFKCKHCLMLFPKLQMLKSHLKEVHPASVVFRCLFCNSLLKTKKTLKHHVKVVHSEARKRECDLCGKVLWSKRAYGIHYRMKHSKVSKVGFRCRICQKKFDSKDERKLHYQVDHEGESPYHCPECGKGFASKSGMYGHRQLHTGSGVSTCEYCGKEFTRKDSYNEHLLIHNGPRHKCPHCPKEFVQRSNLVRHIRIHTGEKPYKCTYCEKRFSDKGACNSHIRVHTREETCSCPFCGQTFSKKQKLKYHIRKHTGEGLINCEICGKAFTNSFALKEHRVIHNRQTQILCPQCGKGFNSEKYLQRHVAIVHEPSNAFSCPLCPKVFSQQARLKAHLMTHTGVKHMKCLLCDKAYSVRKSLRRHLLEKHQVSPEHPQYKHCFHAMSPEEAGLQIPQDGELKKEDGENKIEDEETKLEDDESLKEDEKVEKASNPGPSQGAGTTKTRKGAKPSKRQARKDSAACQGGETSKKTGKQAQKSGNQTKAAGSTRKKRRVEEIVLNLQQSLSTKEKDQELPSEEASEHYPQIFIKIEEEDPEEDPEESMDKNGLDDGMMHTYEENVREPTEIKNENEDDEDRSDIREYCETGDKDALSDDGTSQLSREDTDSASQTGKNDTEKVVQSAEVNDNGDDDSRDSEEVPTLARIFPLVVNPRGRTDTWRSKKNIYPPNPSVTKSANVEEAERLVIDTRNVCSVEEHSDGNSGDSSGRATGHGAYEVLNLVMQERGKD